jgi:ABC-type sugar transport system permease subunit
MTQTTAAPSAGAPSGATPPARRAGRSRGGGRAALAPLLWLGPALALIVGVVLWPAVEMMRTSLARISATGLATGWAGLENYRRLIAEPALTQVLVNTVVWVVGIVAVTVVIGLGLAELLHARFPGRTLVRWALIVPWAASVVMTAIVWRWMLDFFYGVVNRALTDVGAIDGPIDWLGEPRLAFAWMMGVAVFVSLPFATYALLAGLQSIPDDLYEAARVDGASGWQTYRAITLPLLRPALLVATVINVINVFNSFPIIWAMTGGGPGNQTDTTTTFMYRLAFQNRDIGRSAAMAVVNFSLVCLVVALYLRVVRWREQD